MQIKIIKLDNICAMFKIYEFKKGDFFSYNNKLYIKLLDRLDMSMVNPSCYNLSDDCDSYLDLHTNVYQCKNINITYELQQITK